MAKAPTLTDVGSGFLSATSINANNDAIETAFNNTLSRDGSSPNQMEADIDMNSNDLLNVKDISVQTLTIAGVAATASSLAEDQLAGFVFDTKADLEAASVDSNRSTTVLMGYSTLGDGGHSIYKRVDLEPSHGGKIRSTDRYLSTGVVDATNGGWWELVPEAYGVFPEQFGAVNGNSGDNSTAFQAWLDYLSSYATAGGRKGIARGDYRIDVGLRIDDPSNMTLDLHGSIFRTDQDILMLDVNWGYADPTYASREASLNFTLLGGFFYCTHPAPTKATAIRAFGLRQIVLEPKRIQGFHVGVMLGGKDTLSLAKCKFNDNEIDVLYPPWSTIGGPIIHRLDNLFHGHSEIKTEPAIKSYIPLTDCEISFGSYNLGSGAICVAIDIERSLLFGTTGVVGSTPAPGAELTGSTSGATCKYQETYVHPFDFSQAAANNYKTWLVCSDRIGNFLTGETVTDGAGFSFVIGNDPGYLTQNRSWFNTKIAASHFEAGTGANGATGVRFRNRENAGTSALGHVIDVGTCGVNLGGSCGVDLQAIQKTSIRGAFPITTGNTPIRFDANCREMKIPKEGVYFSSGSIDLNGMDRDELDLSDWDVMLRRVGTITGLTALNLPVGSTAATAVDMSTAYAGFETVGGLAPRAYGLLAGLKGTTSSSSTDLRFRLHHPDEVTVVTMHVLQIAGVADGVLCMAEFTVGADDNGDWEYGGQNTGGGTVTASAYLTRIYY